MEWEDFAHYVADYGANYRNLDEHFKPIIATCSPCSFPFNFIVKLESFAEGESQRGR